MSKAQAYCLECGERCSTETLIAVELWKKNHDGRPFATSEGGTAVCRYCFKNDAEIMRHMWSLIGWCSCVKIESVDHFRLVFDSGRRTREITPFSVFPLAESLTIVPTEFEPHDPRMYDEPQPPTDLE